MRTRSNHNRFSLRAEQLESREMLAGDTLEHSSVTVDTTIPGNKGRVSGYVFSDTNGDGDRSTSEDGLAGWKVYVDSNENGIHDKREKSTVTDEHGRYELNLRPMRPAGFGHQITVELQSGAKNTSQTSHSVLIEKDIHKSNKNFGVEPSSLSGNGGTTATPSQSPYGRVSGRVFLDQDENGVKATNEERLAGWVVYVDSNRNGVRDATDPQQNTDSNGRYEFEILPNELEGFGHQVSVVMKSGFENTTRTTRSVLFEAGLHKTNKDFGVIRNNGVSGFVFRDANGDGTRDAGEAKLDNWTVYIDANNNGRPDAAERSTKTNRNGKYEFKSLPTGTHRIAVVGQPTFEFTVDNTRNVTVREGRFTSERNFGVQKDKPQTARPAQSPTRNMAQISGRVFVDANGDSIRSTSEQTLANWRIYIDANRNERRDPGEQSMLTDENGRYEFTLPLGAYRMAVELRGTFAVSQEFRSVNTSDGNDRRRRDFAVYRPSAAALHYIPTVENKSLESFIQDESTDAPAFISPVFDSPTNDKELRFQQRERRFSFPTTNPFEPTADNIDMAMLEFLDSGL